MQGFRIKFQPILAFILLACQTNPVENQIVIINIRNLDRAQIAHILSTVNKFNPAVVGIDATFRYDTEIENDNKFIEALIKTDNLVMPSVISDFDGAKIAYDRFYMATAPEYLLNAQTGFVNAIVNVENGLPSISRFSSKEKVGGKTEYHFAVKVAMIYDSLKTASYLRQWPKIVEINYKPRKFEVYEYSDLSEKCTEAMIKHKILLLGDLGQTDYDIFFTPLNDGAEPKKPDMYGVVHLAHVIAQVLE